MNFQPGDVQLKSGGPLMTVNNIENGPEGPALSCIWFDKTEQKWGTFLPSTLKKIDR